MRQGRRGCYVRGSFLVRVTWRVTWGRWRAPTAASGRAQLHELSPQVWTRVLNSGHAPNIDRPGDIAELLASFVAESESLGTVAR